MCILKYLSLFVCLIHFVGGSVVESRNTRNSYHSQRVRQDHENFATTDSNEEEKPSSLTIPLNNPYVKQKVWKIPIWQEVTPKKLADYFSQLPEEVNEDYQDAFFNKATKILISTTEVTYKKHQYAMIMLLSLYYGHEGIYNLIVSNNPNLFFNHLFEKKNAGAQLYIAYEYLKSTIIQR